MEEQMGEINHRLNQNVARRSFVSRNEGNIFTKLYKKPRTFLGFMSNIALHLALCPCYRVTCQCIFNRQMLPAHISNASSISRANKSRVTNYTG